MEYPLIMIIKVSTLQQVLLEHLTSKGNYCSNFECCQISPTDKPLTVTSRLETKHTTWSVRLSEITQSCGGTGVNISTLAIFGLVKPQCFLFAACIKFEFLAFPSNSLVLDFLNINMVQLLSVILNNGAQSNTSQISVTGKIFVV